MVTDSTIMTDPSDSADFDLIASVCKHFNVDLDTLHGHISIQHNAKQT